MCGTDQTYKAVVVKLASHLTITVKSFQYVLCHPFNVFDNVIKVR